MAAPLTEFQQRSAAAKGPTCRLCGSGLTTTFLDLGASPLCESFLAAEHCDGMEPFYPLHALVCDECHLVQLKEYVSPQHIFDDYAYFSSYSTSWVAHAKAYCEMITGRLGLGADSLAVEIASNDGYLLQHFKTLGVPALGIEPSANVAKVAIDKGLDVRVEFFGLDLALRLAAEGRRADLIVGNNVLAHVPNLNDFVAGVTVLLKPEGVATFEFPHLERLMAECQFDTIYHEHFSYFSFLAVDRLARRHSLKLIDVEELPTHGGSLRVYLAHSGSGYLVSNRVSDLLRREERLGFGQLTTYLGFETRVRRLKRELLSFLIAAKDAGKRICGYGAPGKGNTLLNYCGIGPDFLDFTVDRNPYKHGRFTPGTRIPIRPVEAIDRFRPDYVLILPWNLEAEISTQMRHIGRWGGKFVVPVPQVRVLSPVEFAS